MKMGVFFAGGRTKRPDLHRQSPAFFAAYVGSSVGQNLVASEPAVAPIRDRDARIQTARLTYGTRVGC